MSGLGKHKPAALIAAAAAALVLAACGGGSGSSSGGSAIKQGGVFRMGTSSTIDSLNPFIAFQSDAYTTFEYIYPTLVQYTPSLKIVANFARSWTTSPDGLSAGGLLQGAVFTMAPRRWRAVVLAFILDEAGIPPTADEDGAGKDGAGKD